MMPAPRPIRCGTGAFYLKCWWRAHGDYECYSGCFANGRNVIHPGEAGYVPFSDGQTRATWQPPVLGVKLCRSKA